MINAKEYYDKASDLDRLGKEEEAMSFYESALPGIDTLCLKDQKGLLLGLGSTYRWLSRFQDSARVLIDAQTRFPDAAEFPVFLSLTQLNQNLTKSEIATLSETILKDSDSTSFQQYKRALSSHANPLRN